MRFNFVRYRCERRADFCFGFTGFSIGKTQAKLMGWRHATVSSTFYYLTCVSTTPAGLLLLQGQSELPHTLSHQSETCNSSPAISSTAFNTRPPDLSPASLIDTDFVVSCRPVRRCRLLIRFLYIGPIFAPRFLQTPHGDALALRCPSPPSAGRDLR